MARIFNTLAALLLFSAIPFGASAHSGHGMFQGHELAHYFLSPNHLLPGLLVISVCCVLALKFFMRQKADQQES